MVFPIHRWSPGDPKLTGVQHDENIGSLHGLILALAETGGAVSIASIANNVAGDAVVVTLTDSRTFTVTVASPIWRPPVARVVGAAYVPRDTYVDGGSTYFVLTAHNAAALVSTDVAAARCIAIATAGKDRQSFRVAYDPASFHPAFTIVPVVAGGSATYYQCYADVAANGPGPGNFPWGIVSFLEIAGAMVRITAENKLLSVVIAELRTEIANIKTRLTNASIP